VRNPTTWFQLGIIGYAGPEITNGLGAFLYPVRSRPGFARAFSLGDGSIEGAVPIISIAGVLVLGCLVLVVILLAKKRAHKKLAFIGILVLGAVFFTLRPVCYPLTDAEVAEFSTPIEELHGTGLFGLKYFQKRDGQWNYCKSAFQFWFFF
jgi:hypothetical protein